MPERDYTDEGSDAGELYTGFVHVAQLYSKATGKPLSFYPIYPSKQYEKIYMEKPIVFDPSKSFRGERDRIVAALKAELSKSVIEKDFHIASGDKAGQEKPDAVPERAAMLRLRNKLLEYVIFFRIFR